VSLEKAFGENVGLASNTLKIIVSCLIILLTARASAEVEDTARNVALMQIGPSWNKAVLTKDVFSTLPLHLRKLALSTASFNDGTAFYLGKFNGKHVMATNAHVVLEKSEACRRAVAKFTMLGARFRCQKIISFLTDVELALFTIDTTPADDVFFQTLGVTLETKIATAANVGLFTLGYGGFRNSSGSLTYTTGGFCKTFSATTPGMYLPDPDRSDRLPYKVWSFAMGCNASWGDSGSPVVDLRTGKVLGLLWSSKFPKDPRTRDAKYLNMILSTGDAAIWKQLTYASNLLRFPEVASRRLAKINANSDEAKLLRDLLK
jgi:hypothetical protein